MIHDLYEIIIFFLSFGRLGGYQSCMSLLRIQEINQQTNRSHINQNQPQVILILFCAVNVIFAITLICVFFIQSIKILTTTWFGFEYYHPTLTPSAAHFPLRCFKHSLSVHSYVATLQFKTWLKIWLILKQTTKSPANSNNRERTYFNLFVNSVTWFSLRVGLLGKLTGCADDFARLV